jgi:TolB-like protein/DNA-binding winged helix-turn-helix (wHTH) protein/cytochrome c-type biogenesis protein CcmH/NrfG
VPSLVSTSRRLSFGPFEADLHSGELRKNGNRLRLQAQPFQLLVMLLERPGELVTREEICEKLWSADTFVDFDRSLGTAVNKIREVLGDSATEPRYIETLPRKGYRFIAEVTSSVEAPESVAQPVPDAVKPDAVKNDPGRQPAPSRRLVWAIGVVVLALSAMLAWRFFRPHPISSIAVLPLASLSTDPSQQFLAYGVTDELTTNLAQIASLRVSSHTSSVACSATQKSASELAHCLGVDALVEGSVARFGDKVRITAQLIRGTSDSHIWAHTYEFQAGDVVTAQGELAREIAESISAIITPKEQAQLSRPHPMKPEVADLYFKGSYALTNQHAVESRDLFMQATQLDPDSAEAWAGLADALHTIGVFGDRQSFPLARDAANRALQLDGSQAQALMVLGVVSYNYDWKPTEGEKYFRQAIAARPSYARAHALFAVVLAHRRRFEEGIEQIELARRLDPISVETNAFAWHVYFCARKYDEALGVIRAARDADPTFGPAHWRLYLSLEQKREYQQALEAADPGDPEVPGLRAALASGGERGYWQQKLDNIPLNKRTGVHTAICYMHLGRTEGALKALEESYQRRGQDVSLWLPIREEFDPLQSDPRFQKMLQGMGIS